MSDPPPPPPKQTHLHTYAHTRTSVSYLLTVDVLHVNTVTSSVDMLEWLACRDLWRSLDCRMSEVIVPAE